MHECFVIIMTCCFHQLIRFQFGHIYWLQAVGYRCLNHLSLKMLTVANNEVYSSQNAAYWTILSEGLFQHVHKRSEETLQYDRN